MVLNEINISLFKKIIFKSKINYFSKKIPKLRNFNRLVILFRIESLLMQPLLIKKIII